MRTAIATVSCILLVMTLSGARAAGAAEARLALPEFRALEAKASETVNVTLDSSLINLAASFLDPAKPEDAIARKAIAGLTGIYVRSFTFDADFPYPQQEVDAMRRQLSAPGWQRLVQVHNRKDHNDVDIYVSLDQSRANGLAIIASEPHEFTIVNIVGSIDLQKLHQLEGHFGIPKMELQEQK
jgi:hypothetical protein